MLSWPFYCPSLILQYKEWRWIRMKNDDRISANMATEHDIIHFLYMLIPLPQKNNVDWPGIIKAMIFKEYVSFGVLIILLCICFFTLPDCTVERSHSGWFFWFFLRIKFIGTTLVGQPKIGKLTVLRTFSIFCIP